MNTISAYYKPLHTTYEVKRFASDEQVYIKNKYKLDALAPYYSAYLNQVWDNFFRYSNPSLGHKNHVDKPRLAAFVGFGLMDKMYLNIQYYDDVYASIRELFLRQNAELFEAVIEETDDGWNYDFESGGWYQGDNPHDGESYPCNSKQKELNEKYYNLLKAEIDSI